jgi:hypothetical protein
LAGRTLISLYLPALWFGKSPIQQNNPAISCLQAAVTPVMND